MVRDELGQRPGAMQQPWKSAAAVGLSFVFGALVPVLPFLVHAPSAPFAATILSIAALFGTGAARSRYSPNSSLLNGLQMVLVGIVGTAAGVGIGYLLHGHT